MNAEPVEQRLSRWAQSLLLSTALLSQASVGGSAVSVEHRVIPEASPEPLNVIGPSTPEEMGAFLDGWMASRFRSKSIAGATVTVVKGDQVFFEKGYGYEDVIKRIPVDPQQTLFRPGSISKLFTWTAVMQLVEQGRLSLDADVNTYLKDFKIPGAYSEPITLRNLMTHSAGFEDGGIGYLEAPSAADLESLAKWLPAHMPRRVRPPVRDFSSGTGVAYSNWGAALAGYIVETVSGLPFDVYIERHILQPLAMTQSTFREPVPPQLATRLSGAYSYEDGEFVPHPFEYTHNLAPAASLTSTSADMGKFMLALLHEGSLGSARILQPQTLQAMETRNFSSDPTLNGLGLGFFETWINGHRVLGHGGDTIHFHSELELLPEASLGLFVSFNTNSAGTAATDLFDAFYRHYFPARLPDIKPPANATTRNARYSGTYRSLRRSETKLDKLLSIADTFSVVPLADGTLLFLDPVQDKLKHWVEVGDGVFRAELDDTLVAFKGDQGRSATYLVGPEADMAADRVPWYGSPRLHAGLLLISLIFFISTLCTAIRQRRIDCSGVMPLRWARPVLLLAGGLLIGSLALMGLTLSGGVEAILTGIPTTLYVALALPLIALPAAAIAVYFTGLMWRLNAWSLVGRLHYTLATLSVIAFLTVLYYWNLLGYHLG